MSCKLCSMLFYQQKRNVSSLHVYCFLYTLSFSHLSAEIYKDHHNPFSAGTVFIRQNRRIIMYKDGSCIERIAICIRAVDP